jgi:hypothetical protein
MGRTLLVMTSRGPDDQDAYNAAVQLGSNLAALEAGYAQAARDMMAAG